MDVELPVVVYLTPDLFPFFAFATWKFCQDVKLMVQKIPNTLFNEQVVKTGLGIFSKLQPAIGKDLERGLDLNLISPPISTQFNPSCM